MTIPILIAFSLNLIAAGINSCLAMQRKCTFSTVLAMFHWFIVGFFLSYMIIGCNN